MNKIAKFHKVSVHQFFNDWKSCFPEYTNDEIQAIYDAVRLPKRATIGSAGYDFFSPLSFTLQPQQTIKIPTGIRVEMNQDWVLLLQPRSSLGFKYRLQLDNTIGVIDSDYFGSDNEGHIFVKLTNNSLESKSVSINKEDGIVQGIFIPYGICVDDEVTSIRNGGFGSTNQR